jgi:hypothetical protein
MIKMRMSGQPVCALIRILKLKSIQSSINNCAFLAMLCLKVMKLCATIYDALYNKTGSVLIHVRSAKNEIPIPY